MSGVRSALGRRRRLLGALAASAVVPAGEARAHGTATAGDAPAVALPVVVAVAALAGIGGGLAAVAANASIRRDALAVVDGAVGALLVVLGVAYAASVATAAPALAAAGVAVGLVAAWGAHGHDRVTRDHAAAAAVVTHRTVEGAALAAVYLAGSTVGVAGAVLLAAHATVETVAIGAMYASTDRRRGVTAVLAVQAGFLGGAAAGYALSVAVPATPRVVVVAAGAGALLAVGAGEITHARGGRSAPTGSP
ncbi:hypothetical protein [Halostella salina]|uniref:hypothetical protein n=1 Tax=Halostella salina TaxID=1547897 RepID=UPI000EF75C9C|nr:hypothetical protein [Halostella salina]